MSTGVGMSSCCISGKIQEGTPKGHEEEINGIPTYVSPPKDQSKARSIVFICDIFGYKFKNTRLLADQYAAAGFFVYLPDFHNGDSLPIEFLQDAEPPLSVRENLSLIDKGLKTGKVATTLGPWLYRHAESVSLPLISGFVRHIKQTPYTNSVGCIGFCWGGRYAILMAHELADAAVAQHPSLVSVPGDFDPVTKPLSLDVGSEDSLLDMKSVESIKEILGKKKDTQVKVYEDQVHGFALRGDWSSEKDRKAMDEAEKSGIAWFEKYLRAD